MFVETSKCFPESETEFKCLLVFFPLLPEVRKARHWEGHPGWRGEKGQSWRWLRCDAGARRPSGGGLVTGHPDKGQGECCLQTSTDALPGNPEPKRFPMTSKIRNNSANSNKTRFRLFSLAHDFLPTWLLPTCCSTSPTALLPTSPGTHRPPLFAACRAPGPSYQPLSPLGSTSFALLLFLPNFIEVCDRKQKIICS